MNLKGKNTMNLQEKLDRLKANFVAKAPKETLEIMQRASADLKASGIMEGVLKVGDHAPQFELKNAEENVIRLTDILSESPLVLSFYRGKW